MTHKFSKRIATNTKRSVRKYAIGGRPIKADYNSDEEQVLVFSATGIDDKPINHTDGKEKKLYVKKNYEGSIFSLTKRDVIYSVFTDKKLQYILTITIEGQEGQEGHKIYCKDLPAVYFMDKIDAILKTYFNDAGNVECKDAKGKRILVDKMDSNHKFSLLNDILCKSNLHDSKTDFKTKLQKIIPNTIKQKLNLEFQKPLSLDRLLAAECNQVIKNATKQMIGQAAFANFGTLTTAVTASTSFVSTVMVAAGGTAITGFGLPIAAGLMVLALIANQFVRIWNKNRELREVMFLIWCMCYRFENLINLMRTMATKLEYNIDITLAPLKGVMSRLIAQVSALAPRTTFLQMQHERKKYGNPQSIPKPPTGPYDITDAVPPPQGFKNKLTDKNDVVWVSTNDATVVIEPTVKVIPPKGYKNELDDKDNLMWVNKDDADIIIKNPSEYQKRRIENEEDRDSLLGKFWNSTKRKLSRISSPDENYRVLIRDISILSFWFSIIFSEFMLVAGVRNDVIKNNLLRNDKHSQYDSPDADVKSQLEFIQKQLDFMNDIHTTDEYKQLIAQSLISESPTSIRLGNIKIRVEDAQREAAYQQERANKCQELINGLTAVNNTKEDITAHLNTVLNSEENIAGIRTCSDKIISSYHQIIDKTNKSNFLSNIETELDINEDNDMRDCSDNCLILYLPIITYNTILVNVYTQLTNIDTKFEEKKKNYESKRQNLITTLETKLKQRFDEQQLAEQLVKKQPLVEEQPLNDE